MPKKRYALLILLIEGAGHRNLYAPTFDPAEGRAPTSSIDWSGPSENGRPSDTIMAGGRAHVGVMVIRAERFSADGTPTPPGGGGSTPR